MTDIKVDCSDGMPPAYYWWFGEFKCWCGGLHYTHPTGDSS